MTVREIYQAALKLLFEESSEDYEAAAPTILHVMLPELAWVNDRLRQLRGAEALLELPDISALEDDIPFEAALCREALPWGLAANLLLGDEEEARAANYFTKYAQAVTRATRFIPEPVRDVY